MSVAPISNKFRAPKQMVPEHQKTAKYWKRRHKNTIAAARNRDAKRRAKIQAPKGIVINTSKNILEQLQVTMTVLQTMDLISPEMVISISCHMNAITRLPTAVVNIHLAILSEQLYKAHLGVLQYYCHLLQAKVRTTLRQIQHLPPLLCVTLPFFSEGTPELSDLEETSLPDLEETSLSFYEAEVDSLCSPSPSPILSLSPLSPCSLSSLSPLLSTPTLSHLFFLTSPSSPESCSPSPPASPVLFNDCLDDDLGYFFY